MILQAKAIVTAEALDLVLAPNFNFTKEVRPIVARELAQRATPGRIADRLWGSLAEWVLLDESVPAGEAPGDDRDDEKQFRRWDKTALADAWVDTAVSTLQDIQQDIPQYIPQYTSAPYWEDHPERHALWQTGLSLLRLLATGFRRWQQGSEWDVPATAVSIKPSTNGRGVADTAVTPEVRWQAFINDELPPQASAQFAGNEIVKVYAHLEKLAHQYTDPAFWDGRSEDQAALTSLLTMLRFLVAQIGQTVHEAVWTEDAS